MSSNGSFSKPTSLGSRARPFIPMTPRSLKTPHDNRNDFAKQVSEFSSHGSDGQPPQKKFKASAAPKGTKLASGYVDRAQERLKEQNNDEDNKEERLKNLEKLLKLEQIDQATFDKLRDELGVGGDTSSTHLVKGLDFKLLERVRKGEDVSKAATTHESSEHAEKEDDVDHELEKALERDIGTVVTTRPQQTSSEEEKTPPQSPSPSIQTRTLTRDEILRQLKESRKKSGVQVDDQPTAKQQASTLDHSKFRKLDPKPKSNKHKFTESINGRRREVLIITNKDGTTKRKTRWIDPEPDLSIQARNGEKGQLEAWGGDLPEEVLARQKAAEQAAKQAEDEEDDDDIFSGVAKYDPLAGMNSDDEDETDEKKQNPTPKDEADSSDKTIARLVSNPLKSTSKRDYFATSNSAITEKDEESAPNHPKHDPAILAALKRAAQIRRQEEDESNDKPNSATLVENDKDDSSRNQALLRKLQQQSRQDDLDMDIDMGFGGVGGGGDEDEDQGTMKQKLSEWKGIGHGDDDGEDDADDGREGGGKSKRKRGGGGKKKKTGDKNSYADVMAVLEGRKKV